MGRTLPTFRNLLDQLEAEWGTYARALSSPERERFARLWQRARRHASASSYQSPADPFHAVFVSILLEHEAELERLRARLDASFAVDGDAGARGATSRSEAEARSDDVPHVDPRPPG